jgi:hypothetical protein
VTLDESHENDDEIMQIAGLTVLINKALHKNLGSLKVCVQEDKGLCVERLKS